MQPVSNSTRRGSAHLLIRNTPLRYREAIVLSIILAAPPMDLEQLPAYQRNHCEPNRLNIGWYPPPCRQHFLREVLGDRIGQHLTSWSSAPDWPRDAASAGLPRCKPAERVLRDDFSRLKQLHEPPIMVHDTRQKA